MCFSTTSNKIITARKDIVVHKLFLRVLDENEQIKYKSLVKGKIFNEGEINEEVKLKVEKREYYYSVSEGYHSYIPGKEDFGWAWDAMCKCIIPKGSKYLKNEREYVSSNIIVGEQIFFL